MIPGSKDDHPSFRQSFGFAIQGFRIAWKTERNIKVMVALGVVALVLAVLLQVSLAAWALILLSIGVVLASELINTSIEAVVDLVSPEYHPLAGRAKDIAAAAVWTLSVAVFIEGVVIFGYYFLLRLGWLG